MWLLSSGIALITCVSGTGSTVKKETIVVAIRASLIARNSTNPIP